MATTRATGRGWASVLSSPVDVRALLGGRLRDAVRTEASAARPVRRRAAAAATVAPDPVERFAGLVAGDTTPLGSRDALAAMLAASALHAGPPTEV